MPTTLTSIPAGRWVVDPAAGKLAFSSRSMWGLLNVRGTFSRYSGTLDADADGVARGELVVETASLDTGHEKRDEHLRDDDFFAAAANPTLTFTLASVTDAATFSGALRIRDKELPIAGPLVIEQRGDRIVLSTDVKVDRMEAGLGWNKAGMIRGPAKLHAEVVLSRLA